MKVFVVSEGYPEPSNTNLGIFAWDQAKALKAIGVDVAFLVLDCRSIRRWRRWGYQHFMAEGIPVFRIDVPLGKIPDDIFLWFSKRAFNVLIQKAMQQVGRPDILHAHFMKTGASVVEASKRYGIPLVITEHSSWLNNQTIPARIVAQFKFAYLH
ncbi:MAG: glycosyltransferase family 4 protein, partial [Clostridiales bacterium]|nr:glycosyltransferase family 4 protein [Clostridiales bacterium]